MATPFLHRYTPEELRLAGDFAEKSKNRGAFYAAKRASRSRKTKTDIENGALGELAAKRLLGNLFGAHATISEVDLNVYEVSQKSWDPDLTVKFNASVGVDESVRVHVKTHVCGRYPHIPPSWVFQKDGKGDQCDKDLLRIQPGGDATDWLVGVLGCVDDPKKRMWDGRVKEMAVADYAAVYGPYQMQTIADKKLFREPEAVTLQKSGNRRVLWASDLEQHVPSILGLTL